MEELYEKYNVNFNMETEEILLVRTYQIWGSLYSALGQEDDAKKNP